MQTGISLYFGDGVEKNEETIERARRAGARLAFTSMHIPEEEGVAYRDAARPCSVFAATPGLTSWST